MMADASGAHSTEVHLWVARLDQRARVLAALSETLTDEERERAAAIPSAARQRRFVATRGILRTLLAAWLGCRPEAVPIVRPGDGKPAVVTSHGEAEPVRFNLSHSDDLAVVGITRDTEVGVDVERLRPLWNPRRLAARILAPEERAAYEATADPDEALLVRWTLKEAVLKGMGDGLARDPASVLVDGDTRDDRPRPLRIDGEASPWSVRGFTPAAGYVGAVAAQSRVIVLRLRPWSALGAADELHADEGLVRGKGRA